MYVSMFIGGHKRRKEELWSSAKIMGIPEANVTILKLVNLIIILLC